MTQINLFKSSNFLLKCLYMHSYLTHYSISLIIKYLTYKLITPYVIQINLEK